MCGSVGVRAELQVPVQEILLVAELLTDFAGGLDFCLIPQKPAKNQFWRP